MRVPGWCERCRKIRQVRVGSAQMTKIALGQVATGICAQCEQENHDKWRRSREQGPTRFP